MSKCGCTCVCHTDETSPDWPGPCAACCEAGQECDCGVAQAMDMAQKVARGEYYLVRRDEYIRLQDEAWKYRDLLE